MPERLKASAGAIMSRDVPTLACDASVADAADFCPTIEAELKAKAYVNEVTCGPQEEPSPSLSPNEPLSSP
jgi:hypothetical protein